MSDGSATEEQAVGGREGQRERTDTSDNECPECGQPIAEKRVTCPNCGYEYGEKDYAVGELDDDFSTELSKDELDEAGLTEDTA